MQDPVDRISSRSRSWLITSRCADSARVPSSHRFLQVEYLVGSSSSERSVARIAPPRAPHASASRQRSPQAALIRRRDQGPRGCRSAGGAAVPRCPTGASESLQYGGSSRSRRRRAACPFRSGSKKQLQHASGPLELPARGGDARSLLQRDRAFFRRPNRRRSRQRGLADGVATDGSYAGTGRATGPKVSQRSRPAMRTERLSTQSCSPLWRVSRSSKPDGAQQQWKRKSGLERDRGHHN